MKKPNWILLIGLGVAAWYFFKKKPSAAAAIQTILPGSAARQAFGWAAAARGHRAGARPPPAPDHLRRAHGVPRSRERAARDGAAPRGGAGRAPLRGGGDARSADLRLRGPDERDGGRPHPAGPAVPGGDPAGARRKTSVNPT